jgi:hypothetical protein
MLPTPSRYYFDFLSSLFDFEQITRAQPRQAVLALVVRDDVAIAAHRAV